MLRHGWESRASDVLARWAIVCILCDKGLTIVRDPRRDGDPQIGSPSLPNNRFERIRQITRSANIISNS